MMPDGVEVTVVRARAERDGLKSLKESTSDVLPPDGYGRKA